MSETLAIIKPGAVNRKLWQDQSGISAIEYAIIMAGIAGIVVVVGFALGAKLSSVFNMLVTAWGGGSDGPGNSGGHGNGHGGH